VINHNNATSEMNCSLINVNRMLTTNKIYITFRKFLSEGYLIMQQMLIMYSSDVKFDMISFLRNIVQDIKHMSDSDCLYSVKNSDVLVDINLQRSVNYFEYLFNRCGEQLLRLFLCKKQYASSEPGTILVPFTICK
jgi:hypothetical protein